MVDQVLKAPTNPHFFQPLLPSFHSHLNVPLKFFSKHIEGRNKKHTVELKSNASKKTWKVKMEEQRLTVGWKDFADAHSFRVGDIIIFRHEGDLVFHVMSFGPSCCEIRYVQSCNNDYDFDNDQDNIGNLLKKQNVETEQKLKKRNLETEAKSFSSDQSCFVAPITKKNLQEDRLFLPRKFLRPNGLNKSSNKIVIVNKGPRTWMFNLKFRESSGTFYIKTGWRSFCHENKLQHGDSITFKLEINNTRTPLLRILMMSIKGKRKLTYESSHKVSSSSLSENRFVTLTVRPTSIRDCRLFLPKSFTKVNRMEIAGKKIILLDKYRVEWPVNLVMEKKTAIMRLGSGLNEFLKANEVKAYESFVLELVWEDRMSPPMLKFCFKIKT